MVKLQINYDKCVNCGQCIFACPANVFQKNKKQVIINKNMICIGCLHCAAACHKEAVVFCDSVNNEKTILSRNLFQNSEFLSKSIETHITERRSYRNFKDDTVDKEEIMHALNIASWAPSAKNEHPTKWMIIEDNEKLVSIMEHILRYVKLTGKSPEIERLYKMGKNIVMGQAKTIIIGYAPMDATNPHIDTVIALYSAELILQSHGIGTCWSGYLLDMCNDVSEIRDMLQIPEGSKIYGVLLAGYPENEEYVNIPNRLEKPEIKWI